MKEQAAKQVYGEKYKILTECDIENPVENSEVLRIYKEGGIIPSNIEKFEKAVSKKHKRR